MRHDWFTLWAPRKLTRIHATVVPKMRMTSAWGDTGAENNIYYEEPDESIGRSPDGLSMQTPCLQEQMDRQMLRERMK